VSDVDQWKPLIVIWTTQTTLTYWIRHYETVQIMTEAVKNEGKNIGLYINVGYAKS